MFESLHSGLPRGRCLKEDGTAMSLRLTWIAILATFALTLGACSSAPYGVQEKVETTGQVTELVRVEGTSFRYLGRYEVKSPAKYAGTDAMLLALSFDKSLEPFNGRTIRISYHSDELEKALRPTPAEFGAASAGPHLTLAYIQGAFQPIDLAALQATPVTVDVRIKSYKPDAQPYFVFDVIYVGDMVEAEVLTPAKYHGTIFHILMADQKDLRWKNLGARIRFTTEEDQIALQPWGFATTDDLKNLSFLPN